MPHDLPHHPVEATLHPGNLNWTLHMHRHFPQDRETVWDAITKADLVARWMPFRPAADLLVTGDIWLTPTDGGEDIQGHVLHVNAPSSLRYLRVADELRFEVSPMNGGTALVFAQTFEDRNSAAAFAAGWHLCLAALERLLAGQDIPPRTTWDDARADLEREYAALFTGNDSTPEPMSDL